jgi:long-chain fatty acid transport protein
MMIIETIKRSVIIDDAEDQEGPEKMNSTCKRALCAGLSALALSAGAIGSANATDGYFVEGVSARDQALGGAGSANPADAFTTFINPAGLVDVGHQMSGDVSLFEPSRGYNATNTNLVAPGGYTSGRDIFVIPSLAYSAPLDADRAIGLSLVGNGGMDTSYAANIPGSAYCGGARGVFCGGGRAGVDLNQGLISLGYAQRFGNLSIGIAPTMAVQAFSAYGLGAFGGLSSNPAEVSNHSPAYSVGAGVRAGALYRVNDQLNFAVTGSTPIWSTPFHQYSGLFAGGGNFDVPATIGAGLSYKVIPTFAVMLDWRHIFYSSVNSIGDQMTPLGPGSPLLGSTNGPGFGWKDVNVISIGAEWKYSAALILRAGYSYNTQPVTPANVMFNILAPGVVTNHVSGGFTYAMNRNSAIDFAVIYAPRTTVSGQEYSPGFGYNPTTNIAIHLSELEVTLGYTYHFDVPPPAVIAKY